MAINNFTLASLKIDSNLSSVKYKNLILVLKNYKYDINYPIIRLLYSLYDK